MKKFTILALALLMLTLSVPTGSRACTEVRVTSKDDTCVIGRSMEFGQAANSNIIVQPRGQKNVSKLPDGKDGAKWTSKYGVMYLDGFGIDIATDGMNEMGLSMGALFFPEEAVYQEAKSAKRSKTITNNDLTLYILQNFATVDEVREELPNLKVVGINTPQMGNIVIPAHLSVYEPGGKGIIIEYTKDGLNIYDSIGVMTNSPAYPWHVTNTRNYVDLTAVNIKPTVINGVSFAGTGQGSGLLGIPGDPTPPGRFIRAAAMAYLASPVETTSEAVNLAVHILNTVDIPIGIIRDFDTDTTYSDYTQWIVVKDLANRIYYYRTYDNLTLRSVEMSKFDLSKDAPRFSMPLASNANSVIDVTSNLKPAE